MSFHPNKHIVIVQRFFLQGEKKKKKKEELPRDPLAEVNNDDPFAGQDDAEHDKMMAIARSFEAKYVCTTSLFILQTIDTFLVISQA